MNFKHYRLLLLFFLALTATAFPATTRYVNGITGSNVNNCLSATTACQTIGHAIALSASGDTIRVAAATYTENLTITINLHIIGSGAPSTIIDGGAAATVVTISSNTAHVSISSLTMRNGRVTSARSSAEGGGIFNSGTLTLKFSTISGSVTASPGAKGGGLYNAGTATIYDSTINGNQADGVKACYKNVCAGGAAGGGIYTTGSLTITNTTISDNSAFGGACDLCEGLGGGIYVYSSGSLSANSITLAGNSSSGFRPLGGGVSNDGEMTLQNSIVANSLFGGNCAGIGTMTSNGYNLSSDTTCNFTGPGDMNSTDPMLGPLQYNAGPTQTMALPSGSPAIDAGNPAGCTDGLGHLLKTDQRGKPRPDKEDTGGCDIGAFESQTD